MPLTLILSTLLKTCSHLRFNAIKDCRLKNPFPPEIQLQIIVNMDLVCNLTTKCFLANANLLLLVFPVVVDTESTFDDFSSDL